MRRFAISRISPLTPVVLAALLAVVACCGGCGRTRTVLVPPGEPVQLAEPVEAYVYVDLDGTRSKSSTRVVLPEGWWCLPDTEESTDCTD